MHSHLRFRARNNGIYLGARTFLQKFHRYSWCPSFVCFKLCICFACICLQGNINSSWVNLVEREFRYIGWCSLSKKCSGQFNPLRGHFITGNIPVAFWTPARANLLLCFQPSGRTRSQVNPTKVIDANTKLCLPPIHFDCNLGCIRNHHHNWSNQYYNATTV